jgi:hypothetical protein
MNQKYFRYTCKNCNEMYEDVKDAHKHSIQTRHSVGLTNVKVFLGFADYEWKMMGQVIGVTILFLGGLLGSIVLWFSV